MKSLCIYHGNCADGFGAAWVVRHALNDANVEFLAANYGMDAPDVSDRLVFIVDFSFPLEVLQQMAESARAILVIDHHKSAAEALAALPAAPDNFAAWSLHPPKLSTVFDMARSGAGLTWDFFFPFNHRPPLINHIEDRDLWRFKLDGTREVMANVFSHPQAFEDWDRLMNLDPHSHFSAGLAIERKHHKDVSDLVGKSKRRMTIGGYEVPVANLPYTMFSDAGSLMAEGEPFAACYTDTAQHRQFSLRSTDASLDVSEIAKLYGGGGHRNAAGFSVPFDHPLACNAPPLKCYQVGEQDLVAAYTPEQAITILCSFSGYPSGEFTVEDVSAWADWELDRPCFEEDGITPADPWRKAFAACTYPQYLGGWE